MAGDIDPVLFGRLLASVETLQKTIEVATEQNEALAGRVAELESKLDSGRRGLTVIALVAGFAIFGVKETLQALFKALT